MERSIYINDTNQIDPSARLHPCVKLGSFNRIGKNVVIDVIRGSKSPKAVIGDNNIINDNTRILVGDGGFFMLDWNVLHNDMLIMAENTMNIGHNCWFGQNTILDAAGGLEIGNGVRVGMYSQIWTHVASGELIEGCTLYGKRKTIIEDDVWLVGSCVVSSGVILARRSICLINSVITKSTIQNSVYSGAPAKIMEHLAFWKVVHLEDKFDMMYNWAEEFSRDNSEITVERKSTYRIEMYCTRTKEKLIFVEAAKRETSSSVTEFDMNRKTFQKKNTSLEREFYKFIYNHKARFLPEI